MAKGSDNLFPSVLVNEGTVPATPAAGTQRLYIDSADHKMKRVNSSAAVTTVEATAASLASAAYLRSSGDYTTTSTTFVDVDGTNMSFTITTGAHRVMVGFAGLIGNSTAGQITALDVTVDGTRQGGTFGLVWTRDAGTNLANGSFVYLTDVLSAGSHTFKLQWRVGANTGTLAGTGNTFSKFWAMEQYG